MTIYEELQRDKEAKRLKKENLSTLSLLMSEICKDGKPLPDEEAIKRLSQMKKVCDKNISLYRDAGKYNSALSEIVYQSTIDKYLPKGATELDIENVIEYIGLERSMKRMGQLMKELKKFFQVVDGNLVKSILLKG